jgi:hypothetical protein
MAGIPLPQGDAFDSFLKGFHAPDNLMKNMLERKRLAQQHEYMNTPHPSGDVANALHVEMMRNQYGEQDPRYIEAKRAHEMALSGRQSLMDYRQNLSSLAPYRAATPEEKLIAASRGQGVLNGGLSSRPGFGQQSVPGQQGRPLPEDEARVFNQALGKKTTDAAIRNKIPYAQNVKITMDSINPEALVQYSGPQGNFKYGVDSIKAGVGNAPPEFMEYQKALTSAKTLSKQLRQFWGDSIQPSATDKIDQLTNPSHWSKNPEVALQQFNQLKQITEQELQTFANAGTSPLKLDFDKKTGNFYASPKDGSNKPEKKIERELSANTTEDFLKQMEPALLQINPNYTIANIKATAKKRGISEEEVIDQLNARARQGVQ